MPQPYFIGKKILIISPEAWTFLFVSKHHYAIELAKNNTVYFVGPPGQESSVKPSGYLNLSIISYTPFVKGLRYMPSWMQRLFMRRKYTQLEKLAGVTFDCVWSFDNSVFFDFSFLPDRVLKISHIVDLAQDFNTAPAAATASFCLGVSPGIVDKLKQYNPHTFLIPHGVMLPSVMDTPVKLPGTHPVKAVYAGNLDSQFLDKPALFSLMNLYPTVDFIYLGSGGADWPRLENAHYPGKVPYEKLVGYLKEADVLIMVYDTKRFQDQLSNSHKLLSYLASGKTIISSWLTDYADRQDMVNMVKQNEELPALFGDVVTHLSDCNSEQNQQRRRAYALANTYTHRVAEIETIIARVMDHSTSNQ